MVSQLHGLFHVHNVKVGSIAGMPDLQSSMHNLSHCVC